MIPMEIIATIRSDFPTKFGIPRQSGLVEELRATVVFEPEYRSPDALRGLEDFSHLWLIWQFSEAVRDKWSPTVRPPRLGGNTRMGVFATRSPFRPNPIGLSCVRLEGIRREPELGHVLEVSGADLMDGTPILDINPYIPYADCRPEHSGAQAAVVGLSGGLDSTLAILITSVAMRLMDRPASDMIAVTMPCFGTTERTRDNAVELAERLGATLRRIDIGAAVRQHFKDIGQSMDDHDVTFENSQARERTQVLMDVANQCGGLVVGTGDLSELALGWATYNGDHMSMYSVNASIPKTLVRRLVSYVAGDKAEEDEALSHVLSDILDTPVSPELLPAIEGQIAQKTEDLVGPYELHDFFLYYAIRWAFPPRKVLRLAEHAFGRTYPRAVVLQWLRTFYRRFFAQQFKRSCLPDGPKVGSVSLSPRGDWRMPSDAVAALWLEELEGLE